jgi:hypothetical protein
VEIKNLPVGCTVVLPATDLVLDVFEKIQEYAKRPGQTLIAHALVIKSSYVDGDLMRGINRSTVAHLIAAMYLDMLNSYAKWSHNQGVEHHFHQQWAKMVEGWESRNSSDEANRLFVEVFRNAYDQIDARVTELLNPKESWNVWYVRRNGLDVLAEKGPDFRILDWERRMRLGTDYLKAKNDGEPIPEQAWLPDEEARRFCELLTTQQARPSMLGQSSVDTLDANESKQRRGRRVGPISRDNGSL